MALGYPRNRTPNRRAPLALHQSTTLAPVKLLFFFFVVLLLIGGGMKLVGAQIPVLDYPLGGPMQQPQIEIVQPDLNLP
jgi:hypothetical protein